MQLSSMISIRRAVNDIVLACLLFQTFIEILKLACISVQARMTSSQNFDRETTES